MKTLRRTFTLPLLSCLFVALAGCAHRVHKAPPPHIGGEPDTASHEPQYPGMTLLGRVYYNQQWLTINRNETLLLLAEGPKAADEDKRQRYKVLVGAYPQNTGSGTLTILNEDVKAQLDGDVYAYAKGVRPITVTKRIRTYSPATETAVWCRDSTNKDFFFAFEGNTTVKLLKPKPSSPACMVVPQGYCVRVYGDGPNNTVYFKDDAPLKISDLDNSGDAELKSMYKFYQTVYGFAVGAGLTPTSAAAPPPSQPTAKQPTAERPAPPMATTD
ncbi:MAG: hypothetical protein KF864_03230 [Phycisphaeraceae bacterium]|nr:hypothetical protein [Phycisphaeraceae bacterium]